MAKFIVIITILTLFVFSWMNYDIGDNNMALIFGISGLALIIFSFIYSWILKPAHDKLSRDPLLDWIEEN
jgi:predicted membrane channel-forming protein YqfA (hemolysin III family)